MNKKTLVRASTAVVLAGTLTTVCLAAAEAGQDRPAKPAGPRAQGRAQASLLDVNYKDGSLNSGIPDLTTTHAKAKDASYTVESGDDHAVAHKVTLGDSGYESDGQPRSESATNAVDPEGIFHVGDARRYEFSVMLKDWQTYKPGGSDTGDIIFQGKHSGGNHPSFYLMAKRNSMAFRSPNLSLQADLVDDFRPYINKWMRFRVDVHWADDKTGSYKISTKMPGESDFTLRKTYHNVQTWNPEKPADFGYVKWGLYRPDESLEKGDVKTRIVQHDNISIQDLAGN